MIHTRIITGLDSLPGVRHTAAPGEFLRILVRLEPEQDGTPAVGYYVEAWRDERWVCVTDSIADFAVDGMDNIRAIELAAHSLDDGLSAWISEHGAEDES
jgi:hypothetical protein